MNRGTYNSMSTTRSPDNQLFNLLGRIQSTYKKNDLHLLMFLVDMSLKNFSLSLSRIRLTQPKNDENLNITLHQKCCEIKAKNKELIIKLLNLHAAFTKHFYNNRKVHLQKKYQANFQIIQQKVSTLRQKLARLKKKKLNNCRVTNNTAEITKHAVLNLKQVAQTLSHETIKAKVELGALLDFLPEPEVDYK